MSGSLNEQFYSGPRNTGGLILLFHFSIRMTLFNFGYIWLFFLFVFFHEKKILNFLSQLLSNNSIETYFKGFVFKLSEYVKWLLS